LIIARWLLTSNNTSRFFNLTASLSIPAGLFNNNVNVTNYTNVFFGSTLPVNELSQLYIELEATNANSNVPFHGGSGQYDPNFSFSGNTTGVARADLVTRGWILTDGGSL
jgi:hypothetical protein